MIGPDGVSVESMLRFKFPATNNEAEYEAIILGLQLANGMGIKALKVASDSQLVVGQVKGEFEAKDETMMACMIKV